MTNEPPADEAPVDGRTAPAPLHHETPPDARRAASLLLLRDGAHGLEVLMLRRAERDGDLRSGAVVFPGGVLDPADRDAHPHGDGPSDAVASAALGVAGGGLDYWVAAVRETYEEAGVLLARRADGQPLDLALLQPWRSRLQAGQGAGIAGMCAEHGLTLDLGGLVYWSHWLTPPGLAKRFDTRFFATAAPPDQEAVADLEEAVELMWLTPQAALASDSGLKLLPVTRRTLQQLAVHASAPAALAAARERTGIRLVMPRRGVDARGPRIVLPDEAPYAEIARLDPDGRGDAWAVIVPGRPVRLSERIVRITAPNAGRMTGPGTNTYLVGDGSTWAVVDPGPDDAAHRQAVRAAAGSGRIVQIVATHTHRDHSPAAAALAAATGAPVAGMLARHPRGQDGTFAPDRLLAPGDRLTPAPGCTLRVLHTPGHASNHLCYLLEQERTLFTGDHVMQGSTVVIDPPDGDMAAYVASLRALLAEDLDWLAPGHGFLIADPRAALRSLIAHRLARRAKVAAALEQAGPATLEALLLLVYDDAPAALHPVAARSLLAQLLELQAAGAARCDGVRWSPSASPGRA